MSPQTRYARSGDLHIAYQVVGEGPMDLIYVPSWISQVEHYWDEPMVAGYFRRLTSFSRLILFDRRGSGMSDPVSRAPTLEEQMDDVVAVMEAAGSDRAAVFALLEGGADGGAVRGHTSGADHGARPVRSAARMSWAPDYDWAMRREEREAYVNNGGLESWGDGSRIEAVSPSSAGNVRLQEWYGKLERLSASPGTAAKLMMMNAEVDVRAVLPTHPVPTLVLHRSGDKIDRHPPLAATWPSTSPAPARRVARRGRAVLRARGGEPLLDEIEEFLTGSATARGAPNGSWPP